MLERLDSGDVTSADRLARRTVAFPVAALPAAGPRRANARGAQSVVVAAVAVAGVAFVATRLALATRESISDVQTAIDRGNAIYLDALVRGDARRYASLFAVDAVSMPARGTMVRGRDAIAASITEAFRHIEFAGGSIHTSETRVDGATAYELGHYRFDVYAEGHASRLEGRYVVVWRKVRNRWKIAVDASQPNAPE